MNVEQAKYQRLWNMPEYRAYSPGSQAIDWFVEMAHPKIGDSVLDIGCGSGKASAELMARGYKVLGIDFASNCLDDDACIPFMQADLRAPLLNRVRVKLSTTSRADFAFCADFMEHMPTEWVMYVLNNIKTTTKNCWFLIPFTSDVFGRVIGQPLHLTVRPFTWWRDRMREIGDLVDARDLMGRGVFLLC